MQTSCSGINTKKEPSLFSFQNSKNKKTSICQLVHQKLSNNSPKEAVSIWEKFMVFESVCWKYFSVEADWVQGEYDIFMSNYPSGKAKKAEIMTRLTTGAAERFPNADAANVANTLYPAFDPEDKGEVDFIGAAKGVAILFAANIKIRAELFFS